MAPKPEDIERVKRDYYQLAGWDRDTGFPTKLKLQELGIEWVWDELQQKVR